MILQWESRYEPHQYLALPPAANFSVTGAVLFFPNKILLDAGGVIIAGQGVIPSWNTAGRPSGPVGIVGFNFDLARLEAFDGSAWR